MKANVVPLELVVGPSENFRPWLARCLENSSELSTSNARCVKSGCTCTGPLPGKQVISISSSLPGVRSEEHTSELQSLRHLVCRLLLEKKKTHLVFQYQGTLRALCVARWARTSTL